jgi:hypothetical protein
MVYGIVPTLPESNFVNPSNADGTLPTDASTSAVQAKSEPFTPKTGSHFPALLLDVAGKSQGWPAEFDLEFTGPLDNAGARWGAVAKYLFPLSGAVVGVLGKI